LHHCTASGTTRTAAAVLQSEKSGKSDRCPATAGWANSPVRPPTWGSPSATTAAITDPTIAIRNWTKSVKTTPDSPELAAYSTVTAKAHQSQFWLTPPVRTRSVTRFGVSVENVVATSDTPRSHHDSRRPERKNSWRP